MLKVPGQLCSISGCFGSQPSLVCYIDYSALFKSYDFGYFCQVCLHMPKMHLQEQISFPAAMAQIMLLLTSENSKLRLCAGQLESGQFLLEPLHRSQSTKVKTLKILRDSFVG